MSFAPSWIPEHISRGIRQSGEHVVAEIQLLDRERSQRRRQFLDEGEARVRKVGRLDLAPVGFIRGRRQSRRVLAPVGFEGKPLLLRVALDFVELLFEPECLLLVRVPRVGQLRLVREFAQPLFLLLALL